MNYTLISNPNYPSISDLEPYFESEKTSERELMRERKLSFGDGLGAVALGKYLGSKPILTKGILTPLLSSRIFVGESTVWWRDCPIC